MNANWECLLDKPLCRWLFWCCGEAPWPGLFVEWFILAYGFEGNSLSWQIGCQQATGIVAGKGYWEITFFSLQAQSKANELELAQGFKLSKGNLSDVLPPRT